MTAKQSIARGSRREAHMDYLLGVIRAPDSDVKSAVEEWLFCNHLSDEQFEQVYPFREFYNVDWGYAEDILENRMGRIEGIDPQGLIRFFIEELQAKDGLVIYGIQRQTDE